MICRIKNTGAKYKGLAFRTDHLLLEDPEQHLVVDACWSCHTLLSEVGYEVSNTENRFNIINDYTRC